MLKKEVTEQCVREIQNDGEVETRFPSLFLAKLA